MKNQKIEAGLNRAIDQITPDIYNKVANAPIRKMQTHDQITSQAKADKPNYRLQLVTAFAMFALIFGLFIGWTQFFQTIGIVDLDVNPSIELKINRQNRVVSATALNLDGVQILSGMNLRFVKLDNAIDAILGSMITNGYLTKPDDAILVTVLMNEASRAEQLKNSVIVQTSEFFPVESSPAIYTQSLRDSQDIKSKANDYQVSRGVMNLIELIQQQYPDYNINQLTEMPVQDLYKLAYQDDKKHDDLNDLYEQDGDDDLDERKNDNGSDDLEEDDGDEQEEEENGDSDDNDIDDDDDDESDDDGSDGANDDNSDDHEVEPDDEEENDDD